MKYYNHDFTRLERIKSWQKHYESWWSRQSPRRLSFHARYHALEVRRSYHKRAGPIKGRLIRQLFADRDS